jgi:HD-GYP domain-containing protein (c-di-GMP phosphodiesterase class II)
MGAGPHPVEVPLSEVIGALSYALDLTEGEPPGHAVRTCAIGMRIAEEIGLQEDTRGDLFYALLMKDAGCSANSARMAALFAADERVAKRTSKRVNWSRPMSAFVWSVRTVTPGGSVAARVRQLRAIRDEGQVTRALMRARCDRGAEIARRLGLSHETAEGIRALDEHWDGGGQPEGLRGDEIPLLGRILCLAQTTEIFHADHGVDAALRVARRRRGGWFDPELVAALHRLRSDTGFWAALAAGRVELVPPGERHLTADDAYLDRIAEAFAAVIDAKSPWTYRHSDRTCVIATSVAALLGCDERVLGDLRRAALLHDIGKLAISSRILDKPAHLTEAEFARVRRHPLFTQRILERTPGFHDIAPLAAAHHERLDGRGYPHGLEAPELTLPMRILAVADVYEALTSKRPYRPAMDSGDALQEMRAEVPSQLDGLVFEALEGVLEGRRPVASAETVFGRLDREA